MSFLNFVGGMAKKANEINAEERAFEKDLYLQTAKIKAEADYDPDEMLDYTIGWNYTDAKGVSQKTNLNFLSGNPLDSDSFKDENDRINTAQTGINAFQTMSPEARAAIIAASDPNDPNHPSYLKIKPIMDMIGQYKIKSTVSANGKARYTGSQIIGMPADITAHFFAPHDTRVLGANKINSAADILELSNINLTDMSIENQDIFNEAASGLFDVSLNLSTLPTNATRKRLSSAFGSEVLLKDQGTTFQLIGSALQGNLVQQLGNTSDYVIAGTINNELTFGPQVDAMRNANFNAVNITYEISKALFGYDTGKKDKDGKPIIVEGLSNYRSSNAIFNVKTRVESFFDFTSDLGKVLNPQFTQMSDMARIAERRVASAAVLDNEGKIVKGAVRSFYTDPNDPDTGKSAYDVSSGDGKTLIKDKSYDGMTIEQANKINYMDTDIPLMQRIQALQIHLAFQVAIASQGYEGGKAVSDADFDRAWASIGAGGKGIFASMTSKEEVSAKMKVLIGVLGNTMAYNQAYAGLRDGVKEKGAELYRNAMYDYWYDNEAGKAPTTSGEVNDFGYWFVSTVGQPSPVDIDWDNYGSDTLRFKGFQGGSFGDFKKVKNI